MERKKNTLSTLCESDPDSNCVTRSESCIDLTNGRWVLVLQYVMIMKGFEDKTQIILAKKPEATKSQ